MRQIYLDHASTTPVRPEVVEAMTPTSPSISAIPPPFTLGPGGL
ncbi:MAG: hypothetical protein ACLSDQ_05800 [Adlercreutzia equolifaciens]